VRYRVFSLIAAVLLGAALAACVLPALAILAGALARPETLQALCDGPRMGRMLLASACVSGGAAMLALLLGAPLGFLLFRTDMPLRRPLVLGALLTACLPLYVVLTCWMALGGLPLWSGSAWRAAWIMGLAFAPLALLISGVGFAGVDASLEETALLDTGPWNVVRRVTVPQAAGALAAAAGVVLALSLATPTVTDILNVRALADEVLIQFQLSGDPWRAAALALPVFTAVLLLVVGLARGVRRFAPAEQARPARLFRLGGARRPVAFAVLAVAALYLLPFGALLLAMQSPAALVRACARSRDELMGTLTLTPLAATVCAVLALHVAWVLMRRRQWRRPMTAGLVLLGATPAPVVGMGLVLLLNRGGILGRVYDSRAVIVLAQVIHTLPYAVLALLPAVHRVPVELEDAAAIDGCDWLQRVWRVVLPLSWKHVVVAWFVALVLALSEIGASFLVAPAGASTLSIHFYSQIHAGVYPDSAATCVLLLLLVLPAAALLAWLLAARLPRPGCRALRAQ